jgi:hypothetical protein
MCKIFENEMLHLLKSDAGISKIYIVPSEDSKRLEELLNNAGVAFTNSTIQDLPPKEKAEGMEVVITVLELGLHVYKDKIKPTVMTKAKEMQPTVDSIFLMYGLCGNALMDIEDEIVKQELKAVIPKDKDGYIIDDCVGVLLGGKRGYWNELRKESGTWFSTSGWSLYGTDILKRDLGLKSQEIMKYILKEVSHYKRVLIVETGVEDAEFHKRSEGFAKEMDLNLESRSGDLGLLHEAWEAAKQLAAKESAAANS